MKEAQVRKGEAEASQEHWVGNSCWTWSLSWPDITPNFWATLWSSTFPLLKGFHGHSYSLHPTLSVQEQTIWISAVMMRNHMIEPLGGHPNLGDEHSKASQSELQSWGSKQNNEKKEPQRSVEKRFQHTERLGGGARNQESSAFHFYVFQRQHGLMGKTKRPCFCITDGTAGGLGMTQTLKEEPLSRIRLKCVQAWVSARNTTCDFNISHHQERGYLLDFPFLKLYIPAD